MPPGHLHHVICRGIERRKIFDDDVDRDNFIERLGTILKEEKMGTGKLENFGDILNYLYNLNDFSVCVIEKIC